MSPTLINVIARFRNDDNSQMKSQLLRLVAGQVCLHACMAGMRMAAPLWALREGFSAGAVGVLLALFALSQVFLALPAGRFADRHGLKRPVMLSVLTASAGAALAALFPLFAVLCLAALMTGGATGVAIIALQRHVGKMAQDVQALRFSYSWLAIGPAISNFVGPFTAGLLIDLAGFRSAFVAMALLPWLAWFAVRQLPQQNPSNSTPMPSQRAWDLLVRPDFRRLLMVNWFLSSCWDMHTFVVPLLGHERGISASAIGSILGAFAIAAALVRMALPLLTAHIKEWKIITAAMLSTGGLLAIYPLLQGAVWLGIGSALLGITLGCVQPMVMSTLHQIMPPERHGEALGLRLMAINASSVAMPLLFGSLGAVVGVAGLFWCAAASVGLGSRLAWEMRHAV